MKQRKIEELATHNALPDSFKASRHRQVRDGGYRERYRQRHHCPLCGSRYRVSVTIPSMYGYGYENYTGCGRNGCQQSFNGEEE